MIKQNDKKRLLVEGNADTAFFSACFRKARLEQIWVGPPTDFDGVGEGKGNAIALLPDLIDEMSDGNVTNLALIVDADYAKEGGLGFDGTLKKIATVLASKSYDVNIDLSKVGGGFRFKNTNGLPDFGLWIMPNNSDAGFLEDFIKSSMKPSELKFFNHAKSTVESLAEKRFKDLHKSKAEVMTWLAWQRIPGQSMASFIGQDVLELQKGGGKNFIDWLTAIYK